MLLRNVTLTGFKSFRKRTELPISDKTTILIGPNDHGKTNALAAIERLNPDRNFVAADLNDRFVSKEEAYLSYVFTIDAKELKTLGEKLQNIESQLPSNVVVSAQESLPGDTSGTATVQLTPREQILEWLEKLKSNPRVEVLRQCDKALQIRLDDLPEFLRGSVSTVIATLLPKVILFTADTLRQLPDIVDIPGLQANEVMQGVFRLAGIWDERENLLAGNTRKNQDMLREASDKLTSRIRQNWTQGRDLEFYLEYVGNNVRLTVKDKAKSVTAVGERSEGFTSYFAMRMLLVARTEAAQPNGYIFMFDEPGLNLHPKGQVDLQNVFESIAATNQIIYSTHSVFLINKNYPDRNHLVFKNEEGSNIDNKPFVGGWAKVKEHLGLYLSSNFLFADRVLLVEGASDELYVPLILQGLIERGKFEGDLNAFALNSSLNDTETVACATMYTKEERSVVVLVDGDDAGNKRKGRVEKWAKQAKRRCPVISLADFKPTNCSIEDFLEPTVYKEAVVSACKDAIEAGVIEKKSDTWEADLKTQLNTKENKSLGKRIEEVLEGLFGETISDIWIARKYGDLLRAEKAEHKGPVDAYWNDQVLLRLANTVWKALELPARGDVQGIPFTTTD